MKLITEEIEQVEVIVENRNGKKNLFIEGVFLQGCLLYTSPSPRDRVRSRMPSSA